METHGYINDVKKRIRGQRVLDVGCLATWKENILRRHREYKKTASEIIGIDYNKEFLNLVPDANIHYCDMTNYDDVTNILNRFGKFSHIIATDVIEHIDNLGLFLESLNRLSNDDVSIYFTTPNSRSYFWNRQFNTQKINHDHVCWFDDNTLKALMKRYGFYISDLKYCFNKNDARSSSKLGLKFESWMGRRIYFIIKKEINA